MKPENGKRVFADMEERRGKLDEADLQVRPCDPSKQSPLHGSRNETIKAPPQVPN